MDPFRVRNHMETYYGQIKSPSDAIILFEACRQGTLPRVQRRLSEKERQQVRSGSVFVWDEREAGMRRWTDGKSWSASRVSGSFLTYREMEGKKGGGSNGGSPGPGAPLEQTTSGGSDPADGMDGYRYKPDGLVKQSFSISTSTGHHLHLISYFARSHPASANLPSPTSDPNLRHVRPAKGMYPDSTVHDAQTMPAVTRSPMGESSSGDSANACMRNPHPPQFGFPPNPGTPPTVNGQWPGSYFPYGFPSGGFPGMPNGIPAAWAAAWFAQMQMWQQQIQQSQQQNPSQNQQQGPQNSQQQSQSQQQHPNATTFDRAPPPLRANGVPPPPPPAPPQSYPHLQQQNSQSGSSHTPYISPLRNGDQTQTPSYQNSSTFQAQQAQYQAWLERQKQSAAQTPSQEQRLTTTPAPAQTQQQQQPQAAQQNGYGSHGYGPVQNGYSAKQQPQPQTGTPQRPTLQHSTSSESVNSTPADAAPRTVIPSINAMMSEQRDKASSSQPQSGQHYPYAKISPAPPTGGYQRPAEAQAQRMPDSQEPGGSGGQGGYGADMNALRRLDRAFAP